jgi:hypothetical protein
MNFHIAFLNKIPAIELFMGVVLIVSVCYFTAQRKKPWEPVVPPDEDLTGIVASEAAAS